MALLPRTRLSPCPACAELVDAAERRCPHCARSLSEGAGLWCAAALLLSSAALAGCSQALYGVPTTSDTWVTTGEATESGGATDGASTTSGPSGGTSAGTGTGGEATTGTGDGTTGTGDSTGDSSGATGSATTFEPLYGVVEPPASP